MSDDGNSTDIESQLKPDATIGSANDLDDDTIVVATTAASHQEDLGSTRAATHQPKPLASSVEVAPATKVPTEAIPPSSVTPPGPKGAVDTPAVISELQPPEPKTTRAISPPPFALAAVKAESESVEVAKEQAEKTVPPVVLPKKTGATVPTPLVDGLASSRLEKRPAETSMAAVFKSAGKNGVVALAVESSLSASASSFDPDSNSSSQPSPETPSPTEDPVVQPSEPMPNLGASANSASVTPTGLIVASGQPGRPGVNADAQSGETASSATMVGNISVYALVGIIAAFLIIAAGSYIAWDKWRKKKIAKETSADPLADVLSRPPSQPDRTTSSHGSVLRDSVYFPGRTPHRPDMDGTSSFWNESRSVNPFADGAAQGTGAGGDVPLPPMPQMAQTNPSSWTPLPTPFGKSYEAGRPQQVPFEHAGTVERMRPASEDLLGAYYAQRDSRRLTAGTGRTGATAMTATSTELDMVSTYASNGEDRMSPSGASTFASPLESPLARVAQRPKSASSRWTQGSAPSMYSPSEGVPSVPPAPSWSFHQTSPISIKSLNKFRKLYKPLPDAVEDVETVAFGVAVSPVVGPGVEGGTYPMKMPSNR